MAHILLEGVFVYSIWKHCFKISNNAISYIILVKLT
jgi:hypothetical protein